MEKNPVGYFLKGEQLIVVLAKDNEAAKRAIERVAKKHGLDPASVSNTPPPANPGPIKSVLVDEEEDAPLPDFEKRVKTGEAQRASYDGARKFYEPAKAPAGPPMADKKDASLPAPTDYGTLLSSPPM